LRALEDRSGRSQSVSVEKTDRARHGRFCVRVDGVVSDVLSAGPLQREDEVESGPAVARDGLLGRWAWRLRCRRKVFCVGLGRGPYHLWQVAEVEEGAVLLELRVVADVDSGEAQLAGSVVRRGGLQGDGVDLGVEGVRGEQLLDGIVLADERDLLAGGRRVEVLQSREFGF
jgi:hypothetical protein